MSVDAMLGDLHLTAFMSSKICHDLVGPVGAINNGLELLEEETDEETRAYAFEVIQYSAQAAWARLEFARLAFGASSTLGSEIELGHAERVVRAFIEEGKHRLHWRGPDGFLDKDRVRLLMITTAIAVPAVPAGGDIMVTIGTQGKRAQFEVRCRGRGARIPERVDDILAGRSIDGIDPRSILPYYAMRLATESGMTVTVVRDGADIVFLIRAVK